MRSECSLFGGFFITLGWTQEDKDNILGNHIARFLNLA